MISLEVWKCGSLHMCRISCVILISLEVYKTICDDDKFGSLEVYKTICDDDKVGSCEVYKIICYDDKFGRLQICKAVNGLVGLKVWRFTKL